MPRFVILRHETPDDVHFDFMLEIEGVLKTWALPALPALPQRAGAVTCKALPDHRIAYLEYEGPVSADRGAVTRWDCGGFTIAQQNEAEWIVDIRGNNLQGRATICRSSDDGTQWTFSFE